MRSPAVTTLSDTAYAWSLIMRPGICDGGSKEGKRRCSERRRLHLQTINPRIQVTCSFVVACGVPGVQYAAGPRFFGGGIA